MRENHSGQNYEKDKALRESEDKYRRLINQMPDGYALHEIICNDQGHPIDYRYLEVNPAFERMTGLVAESTVGHTVLEILPQTEPGWIENYGKVALTGESIHFENFCRHIKRYFDVTAFRTSPKQFACFFTDITERKRAEEALRLSEATVRKKLKAITEPNGDIDTLILSDIIDTEILQSIMEDFYQLTGMLGAVLDLSGNVLIAVGWQDICTKFHRCHPETLKNCTESDTILSNGVPAGTFKAYRCKNNMWDMVTPIMIGERHVGNVFFGQFFYEDETPDIEVFREQSRHYGFDEGKYLDALSRVPRFSREEVNTGMQFYAKLAGIISTLSFSAIKRSRMLTEYKQAELALAAEKERLAVTLRSIGDGVITTDTNGNIVMLNKAAEALTGWNSDEATGRPLSEVFNIINELTRQQCENSVERVLATGAIVELANHTSLIAKDGREIVIADSGAPIYDNENQIVGVVLVFRDMTEKQKLEDFMQKSQKLESLGVLAGGIAHDFNNLLGGIFGYIEVALGETTEEKVSTYLAKSLSNINRARALTQQLLTFAKGGAPIKKIQNLFPFVQETTQFALSGSSVSSRFQIQDNLWLCDFDKNQIGQVVDNLIINAQQAMPDGGTIEVSARNISLPAKEHILLAAGNYVKLSIKDQGIGIPKEFLPRIFDPYYTTKLKGHGLGLSTCYSIVNRHGGCIDIESEPGKGSTFHVYLPAAIEPISIPAVKTAGKHRGSGTFLVMDDEEEIRNIMQISLESFGYTVVLKENGKDAIDFFVTETQANRKLAGMIFDLTIPGGMGGKEAIREIRKICSNTPAFVASGYSIDPVMANPEKYGFNASIYKPIQMAKLSEMLEKHLKKLK